MTHTKNTQEARYCIDCGATITVSRTGRCRRCSAIHTRVRATVPPPNPSGLCQCGCGELTSVAVRTHTQKGIMAGEHLRFVRGHEKRSTDPAYVIEDRGYKTHCHVWQRGTVDGYGYIKSGDVNRRAHVVYWEQVNGPVPTGRQLDHLCRIRACVNPDHLEPVIAAVNVQRGLNATISADDVVTIRNLYPSLNQSQLARRFGISQAQVWRILNRLSWVNIE